VKTSPATVLGKNVRALRLQRQMTQERLAEESLCHVNYIGGVERGERNPTLAKIYQIACALKVEIADLTRGIK
jgi:transcriptional regulator with XRE-family HTH domain